MAEQRLVTIEKEQDFAKAMDYIIAEKRRIQATSAPEPDEDYYTDYVLLEHRKGFSDPSFCYGQLDKIKDVVRPVYTGKEPTDKTVLDKMSIGELTRTKEDLQEHYETTTAYINFLVLSKKSDLMHESADIMDGALLKALRKRRHSEERDDANAKPAADAPDAAGGGGTGGQGGILKFLSFGMKK